MLTDHIGNTALHILIQVAQKNKSTHCLTEDENGNLQHHETIEREDREAEYLKIVELVLNRAGDRSDRSTDTLEPPNKSTSSNLNGHLKSIAFDDRNTNLLVNKQNVFGKTATHYAVFLKPDKFSIKLLTLLLQAKADLDLADFRQCTPLYYLLVEHQSEHRSKVLPKKCSKYCSQRSPFINLLTTKYKCDLLNLDELDYGIASLQQLCRRTIQKHSPKIESFHLLQTTNSLPVSLCNYLSRRTL